MNAIQVSLYLLAFVLCISSTRLTSNTARGTPPRFFLENIAKDEVENLRKLRGIKFDWGRYNPTFAHVQSNRELTRELDDLGIEREAEEYRGLPWDEY